MAKKAEYPVALRPLNADDGSGWVAIVPDLPGCMSDGVTAHEAFDNVLGAIEEWKEAAKAMGRKVPRPDDFLGRSFDQEIPEHIRKQAEAYARQMVPEQGEPDPDTVHAIIAEWARSAVNQARI